MLTENKKKLRRAAMGWACDNSTIDGCEFAIEIVVGGRTQNLKSRSMPECNKSYWQTSAKRSGVAVILPHHASVCHYHIKKHNI